MRISVNGLEGEQLEIEELGETCANLIATLLRRPPCEEGLQMVARHNGHGQDLLG